MNIRIAPLAFLSILCASWNFIVAQPATAPTAPAAPDPEDAAMRAQLEQMRYQLPLRVVGAVTDAETNQPIQRFSVVPVRGGRGVHAEPDYVNAREFGSGRYEFVNSSPQPGFTLRIEADGYAPVTSPPLSEHIVATFDAKLKRAPNITGQVLTSDEKPAGGAQVLLITSQVMVQPEMPDNPGYRPYARVKTSADGRFTHRPVEGEYLLIALHDAGHARVDGTAHDAAKPLRLEPWARVEGTLRVGSAPGAGQYVYFHQDQAHSPQSRDEPWASYSIQASVDEAGKFTFPRVPAGKGAIVVMVSMRGPQGSTMSGMGVNQRFDVKPGETQTVELGGRGRPVVGRIALPTDLPEDAFAHGTLTPTDPPQQPDSLGSRSFAVDEDGRFRIDDVEPGTYRLGVRFQAIDPRSVDKLLAVATKTFTIDPIPGGQSDEPLDLGTLEAQPATQKGDQR